MIKNEKQYKITKKKLFSVDEMIAQLSGRGKEIPLKDQLLLASLNSLREEMGNDIIAYEFLKASQIDILKERDIDDLPSLITEYKIVSGLTQKEFSKKIGLKEQQLQRYEAEDFKSITFKNLLKILRLIGLDVKIKDTRIDKAERGQSHGNQSIA